MIEFCRWSRGVDRDNSVGDGGEEARARRQEDGRPIPLRRAAEVSHSIARMANGGSYSYSVSPPVGQGSHS